MRRNLTEEQRRKSDERKAKFRALVKQVAAMTDDERSALSARMIGVVNCEGASLSVRNTMLLAMQCPTATIVGGFRQWLKQGRAVRKGEHGACILCPSSRKVNVPATIIAPAHEDVDTFFVTGTVFDISQTEPVCELVEA